MRVKLTLIAQLAKAASVGAGTVACKITAHGDARDIEGGIAGIGEHHELRQNIARRGAKAVIPPRSNRNAPASYDTHQYKHRNLIECHFCRIKHFRRIATRYEKLARRFASFIALVAAFVWLT
jgi:transposase